MAFTEGQVCHEHWAGPHSWDRPLLWILARKQQNDVFGPWWEKHPLECEFERAMWDRHEGLPFLSKKATPPEAVGRSEVRCAQCPLSTAHKTQSWCCNSIQKPLRAAVETTGNTISCTILPKHRMAVCLWLSWGRFLIMHKFYTIILTGSVTPQQMSNVYC